MGEAVLLGSCLCGAVRYQVSGPVADAAHCHCSQCRKAHGAAFGSYSWIEDAAFQWLAGSDAVRAFASSPGVRRTFCGNCGSTLQYVSAGYPGGFWLAIGTLDADPAVRPALHMFVGSKAPWFEITDNLPQHREWPPVTG